MKGIDYIQAQTFHGRKGKISNSFSYAVDYLLLDLKKPKQFLSLFSFNRFNLFSVYDVDHGGPPKSGDGLGWVQNILKANELPGSENILLLAQPRTLGHVFNPVSFWLCYDLEDSLRVVIAEVSNTFGQRHCYLCYNDDQSPITASDVIKAEKVFHVSPFQPIEGSYSFNFDISSKQISITIEYERKKGGLVATLVGPRRALTNKAIILSFLRRPFGSRRVLGLIHWQAVKLWWLKATFRSCPEAPQNDVSR